MQTAVDEYRVQLQDFYTWLETVGKRAESADKGRGLHIAQRVSLLEQLTAEANTGKPKLQALQTKVHRISSFYFFFFFLFPFLLFFHVN